MYPWIQGCNFQIFGDFSKSFQKPWEAMQGSFVKHSRKKNEMMTKLKVTKILIFEPSKSRGNFSILWRFFKVTFKALGSIVRAICNTFKKIKEIMSRIKILQMLIFVPSDPSVQISLFAYFSKSLPKLCKTI